jgi:hypothetical protein
MQRREWYMIDYGREVGVKGELMYYTYESAKAKAGKYPVRKVVVDETWTEPEEEWVTPTDEDARHRPMVQVRLLGDWYDAKLLAVIETDNDDRFIVVHGIDLPSRDRVETYRLCRMKASERNKR